jgi:hypothetical protein
LRHNEIYFTTASAMVRPTRKRQRSDDQRTVTISIEKKLVGKIDQLCARERRSRSNWIVKELERIVGEKESAPARQVPVHGPNEPEEHYGSSQPRPPS